MLKGSYGTVMGEGQGRLSTHALHNSSPCFSAWFLVLKVRSDSIRLISIVWFNHDQKQVPVSTTDSPVLELPLHKLDDLCIGSWPARLITCGRDPDYI